MFFSFNSNNSNASFSFSFSSFSKMLSSSPISSSLTTCCICLERMKEPIRTLPCLHSSCNSCIEQLIELGEQPFRCPICRSPFEIPQSSSSSSSSSSSPSLEPNFFTSHLLAASSSSSSSSTTPFDPNQINCEICEENEAEESCQDCQQFHCLDCKTRHLKARSSRSHQFVSIEDGLKKKTSSSSSSSSSTSFSSSSSSSSSASRIIHCQKHSQQEVNFYCEKCKEACCAECGIDFHPGHNIVRLTTLSQQFKDHISTLIHKVKEFDQELSNALQEIPTILERLKKQAKLTEEHIHQVVEQLRLLLNEREAELIEEISKVSHQKEKELIIQKEGLEFLLKGIRDSLDFSERLVTEGNEVEIAASHKPVIVRFETLETEMKKTRFSSLTDGEIEFVGEEESKERIKGIGAIVKNGLISPERSSIVRMENGSIALNQKYSFRVVPVDKKGNKATETPIAGVHVVIDGPSKDAKAEVVEEPGNDGKLVASLVLNQVGEHDISVLFQGRHFQGSPFKVKVVDRPVFNRDYSLVGDPIMRFGFKGNSAGQLSIPLAVACNSKGEILVSEADYEGIQVFDGDGRSLFRFDPKGSGGEDDTIACGLGIDSGNGNEILVAVKDFCLIQVFDEKGRYLRSFGIPEVGEGELISPKGVIVDQTDGSYFVTDGDNGLVQVFSSRGGFVREFGKGQVNKPFGIGLLSNRSVVVGESGGNRLQIFDCNGNFVRMIGGNGELQEPRHLFVDSDDNILVADFGSNQIQVFASTGDHVRSIGKGLLTGPIDVCMDNHGRIIVCEKTAHRISIF